MIGTKLTPETLLKPSKRCVLRRQVDRTLLYNPTTDELHLVPPSGVFVFHLCNGIRTVTEIVDIVRRGVVGERDEAEDRVLDFLGKLVDRGLLEVQDG